MQHDTTQARVVWPPEPGTFSLRLVRRGWRVPARIQRTADALWQADVDGVLCDAHIDPALADRVATIWHHGLRIPDSEYRWLLALKAHAALYAPQHPCLSPRTPIDPRRLAPLLAKEPHR